MFDKQLILTLGKVIAATAWVDGKLTESEVEHLKDLIFRLSQNLPDQADPITSEEWARLEMYMESPVDDAERERLVAALKAVLHSPEDVETAVTALQEIIQADGAVTPAEETVTSDIQQALQSAHLGRLGQIFSQLARHRSAGPNREVNFAEYVKNQVFFAIRQRLDLEQSGIPETDWRKLSLAGALMAQVAHTDREIQRVERQALERILQQAWGIDAAAATLVAEIAITKALRDMDYYRITREFFDSTTLEERTAFLDVLFAVAAADGEISSEETASIRRIARSLQLRQSTFVQAYYRAQG